MTHQLEWVDTHAHVYYGDIDNTNWIAACREAGVKYVLVPAVDIQSHSALFEIQSKYAGFCFPMIGLHPCSVREDYENELEAVKTILKTNDVVGVGEIGLDFFHDTTFRKEQLIAFECQLAYASSYNLPVSMHTRNATQEALEVISNATQKVNGVLHCFSGNKQLATQAIDYGLFLGIGGTITYKSNNELRNIIKEVGIEHLVLETDSPFLSPHPHRGKTNVPSRIPIIGERLAALLELSVEEVARKTTQNACTLFQVRKNNSKKD